MNKGPSADSPSHRENSGFKVKEKPLIPAEGEGEVFKFYNTSASSSPTGEPQLPSTYGSNTIFLIAQDPHWLFTYWDIDISKHPGGATFLRCIVDETTVESEITVPFETRNWYIPASQAGRSYRVELGYYRDEIWNLIAQSAKVQTPSDQLSHSDRFDYATIPLHLSFLQLLKNIHTAIHSGENLIQALARLQKDGELFQLGGTKLQNLSKDERMILEAILGTDFLNFISQSSLNENELQALIRKHIEERLSSLSASENLAGSTWSASENSLFSALSSFASSELKSSELTSWNSGALSSWAAAALTAWATTVQSSGGAGASLFGQNAAAASSWSAAALSSWHQAALSSWTTDSLSSWSPTETSSWSGSPSSEQSSREFFMHVNAEVIFYGGTDSQATVTIDGKPVPLNSNGSFRFHFIFPDGAYEIPITATSPDGLETRSAILRFHRSSAMSNGVDATPQPPLPPPPGAKE